MRRKVLFSSVWLFLALMGAAITFLTCAPHQHALVMAPTGLPSPQESELLTVLTLNVAHGRGDGFHQAIQSRARIDGQLEEIAKVLRQQTPRVVGLQEADGPSLWSGRFDHVHRLAVDAGFAWHLRGKHVQRMGLDYGTALLTQTEPINARSVTFPPTPPTFTKGFVVATLHHGGHAIDVVSIHLDFARAEKRAQQIEELIKILQERPRFRIILGDFNSGFQDPPIQRLLQALDLHTFEPRANLDTFPKTGARLDWILASVQLEFADHQVLQDVLSDHRAVVARLRLPPRPLLAPPQKKVGH